MAEAIVTKFRAAVKQPHPIDKLVLIPSGGGIFDVRVDGALIYSKHQTGRHAEHPEVLDSISALMAA